MATDNFSACLKFILAQEGGYAWLKSDPGGATNLGVTIGTLSQWRGHPCTVDDVKALTVADVTPIYQTEFWNAAHCPVLPSGLDLVVFDEAVNAGVGRAVRHLQQALGVTPDGMFGPASAAAAAGCAPVGTINALCDIRETFYRSLSTFSSFGKGWLARVERARAAGVGMVRS